MLNVVRIVALGLWVGALAGFAFFFAPAAFAHIGATPAFAATIGACVIDLTRAGWLLGAVAVAAAFLDNRRSKATLVTAIAVAVAILFSIIEVAMILPQMQATPLGTAAYDALHRESSHVYGIALLGALTALIASSWRPAYR